MGEVNAGDYPAARHHGQPAPPRQRPNHFRVAVVTGCIHAAFDCRFWASTAAAWTMTAGWKDAPPATKRDPSRTNKRPSIGWAAAVGRLASNWTGFPGYA